MMYLYETFQFNHININLSGGNESQAALSFLSSGQF